jgi:RNA polymerase sigma-70 factor, ECF subfamily
VADAAVWRRTPCDAISRQTRLASQDDVSLVREYLKGGGQDLFGVLVRRHQQQVLHLCASVLGPEGRDEAQDLVQEVFVQAHRRLASFRGESAFATWLYRLAFNRAVDWRRQSRRHWMPDSERALSRIVDVRRDANPDEITFASQRSAALLEGLDRLPEVQRTVLLLHYWADRSVDEIAGMLDSKPGTVKSHLHRARRALARELPEGLTDE